MKLVGKGTEGVVYQVSPSTVMKVYKRGKYPNKELNDRLKIIDPDGVYFLTFEETPRFSKIVFMKNVLPLPNPKNLSKEQYRHLRKALDILKKEGISHGDLPENVMLHPRTKMPIIIDFDRGKIDATELDLSIDYQTFLSHFKAIRGASTKN